MAGQDKTPSKHNFQTYEAQKRFMAALLASVPNMKIDNSALAKHYGGGVTASAMEHRVREVRKLALAMKLTVAKGLDPQQVTPDILKTVQRDMKDSELHRIYGASTPGGIGFQIQQLKQIGKSMKEAADAGEDPGDAFNLAAAAPGKKRAAPATGGGGPRPRARTQASGATPARRPSKKVKTEEITSRDDSSEKDYDEIDISPTPTRRKRSEWGTTPGTPATPGVDTSRASTLPTEDEVATPAATAATAAATDDDLIFVKQEKGSANKATPKTAAKTAPKKAAAPLQDLDDGTSLIMKKRPVPAAPNNDTYVTSTLAPAPTNPPVTQPAVSSPVISPPAQSYSHFAAAQVATTATPFDNPSTDSLRRRLFGTAPTTQPTSLFGGITPSFHQPSSFSMATEHMGYGYEEDNHDIYEEDHEGEI
ncbi:hypothetical protein QBC34DRAFT_423426 [Podospora aff. communis PSN243]|uniref:Uncharacterized protein n=1 Tax=Podospora aff. communis PSN243 TaxID=3040156 RepID=A0AAV9GV82_9PEZI|nr:hypothetical protein QBC34DRAFT_423426 [Podospora aff. communis PSN243]